MSRALLLFTGTKRDSQRHLRFSSNELRLMFTLSTIGPGASDHQCDNSRKLYNCATYKRTSTCLITAFAGQHGSCLHPHGHRSDGRLRQLFLAREQAATRHEPHVPRHKAHPRNGSYSCRGCYLLAGARAALRDDMAAYVRTAVVGDRLADRRRRGKSM